MLTQAAGWYTLTPETKKNPFHFGSIRTYWQRSGQMVLAGRLGCMRCSRSLVESKASTQRRVAAKTDAHETPRCGPRAAKSPHPGARLGTKPLPSTVPEPYIPNGRSARRPTGWNSPRMHALQRRFSSTKSIRRRICQSADFNIERRRINALRWVSHSIA